MTEKTKETDVKATNKKPTDKKRPTFLTVLCILTFVGAGLGILLNILLLVWLGSVLGSLGGMWGTAGWSVVYIIISIALIVVTLIWAIMMFKLKKIGFYAYTFAKIVIFALPFFMLEGHIMNYLGLVIIVAFIAMYAANFKHLK